MNVFFNYSSIDRPIARSIAAHLANLGDSSWSEAELFPGDNWPLETGKALENSDAMVVLISPESMNSPTIRNQIQYALGSLRFENRLIPVVVRPTENIPWILQRIQSIPWHGDAGSTARSIFEAIRNPRPVGR